MAHIHTVQDTDAHFIIDPITRHIDNNGMPKIILMQNDHNSERFTFVVDRYIEGHDLTLCNKVEVHYDNYTSSRQQVSHGIYSVDDVKVDDEDENKVIFTWLISENATKYAGTLNFLASFVCEEDDYILYRWSTGVNNSISISSGINNSDEVAEVYADVLEQWKTQLFGIGDTEEANMRAVSLEEQAAISAAGDVAVEELNDHVGSLLSGNIEECVNSWLDDHPEATTASTFHVEIDSIDLTENILTSDNWTLGAGWSGNFTNGFTHATSSAETLECAVATYEDGIYILKFTATNQYSSTTENCLLVSVGGSPVFEQYQDDGTVTKYFTFYPSEGDVIFTPSSNWSGTITDIGLYKISHADLLPSSIKINDIDGNESFSVTASDATLNNIVIGNSSLRKVVTANNNIVVGHDALTETATGYFNVAIGNNSQKYSINGTRNVSVGFNAMSNITYGDRNIGIGSFALSALTTGRNNIGIGADTAWNTTVGNHNIAMSNGALGANVEGSNNVAIGYFANGANTTGDHNISVGSLSNSYNTTGKHNIAAGFQSHYKGIDDRFNIAIGYQALQEHGNLEYTTDNIAIGRQAMKKNVGNNNIAVGFNTLSSSTTETGYNIAMGYDVMSQAVASGTEGDNVVLGHSSGRNIAGNNNVAIGRGALNKACTDNNVAIGNSALSVTTGNSNVGIGLQALKNVTTGTKNIGVGYTAGSGITDASNCICIGSNGQNVDNGVYIGNLINYDGNTMGLFGLTPVDNAKLLLPAGTTSVAPIKINPGVLTSTAIVGAIEFDGEHLYFVNRSGVRKQLAEV